jgi:hypothetical protein
LPLSNARNEALGGKDTPAKDQGQHEKDKEKEEQELRNPGSRACNAAKTEYGGDQGDH